ncbi:DUF6455 family protein [Lutimaribacter sp. EGI FJ00015]|uniref:DUF6455 family protein n=1 Tax=Lutimaribacter degradans TaxID=2945989 RepID=A0ACC5ZR94_9RHOB|nr:DUF6455 family protein [Lutimaribacter sp. EGI FJ00013]MCM2560698.1 DUF6455 family protein [Lutimaribacter sp. EGI FJ00013]MCO0612358.1 DUF6455 family protein [Lutimaribacter sp. EGI FJ00015]MCO0634522.1 DUF6455 family protein [Lutimaribacter sp. EGI FJ00014]
MFNKLELHADLVNGMANKADVDLGNEIMSGKLSPSALRGAVLLCTHCTHVGECQGHLRDGAQGDVPGFCLNKQMFEALKP